MALSATNTSPRRYSVVVLCLGRITRFARSTVTHQHNVNLS